MTTLSKARDVKSLTLLCVYLFAVGLGSYLLLAAYTGGDQVYYNNLYDGLKSLGFIESLSFAKITVGSTEPLAIWLLWVGSTLGFDKLAYITFWNTALFLLLYFLVKEYNLGWPFLMLISTNYYVLVLITSAERLKFSFLLILISLLLVEKNKNKLASVFFLASPAAHFQSLFFVGAIYIKYFVQSFLRALVCLKISRNALILFTLIAALMLLFVLFFSETLLHKFKAHSLKGGIKELTTITGLYLAFIFVISRRISFSLSMLVVGFGVFLFGDDRMNMVGVFIVVYYLITERKHNHPLSLLLMSYFSFKSIGYIYNIVVYGNGFPTG